MSRSRKGGSGRRSEREPQGSFLGLPEMVPAEGAGDGGEGDAPAAREDVARVGESADAVPHADPSEVETGDAGSEPAEGPGRPVQFELGGEDEPGTELGTGSEESGREAPTAGVTEPPFQDERLGRAKALVGEGRIEEAVALYTAVVRDHPGNLKALNNLGVLYDELGRPQAAVEQFLAAQRVDPENIEVLGNLGGSLGALGRFDEAETLLRRAQRLAPDDPEPRLRLGIVYFRKGAYAQAEPELRWVCDRDRAHGPAHYYRGEALNRLGRYDEAFEVLQTAAELLPEDPRVFYTLGTLRDRRHEPAEAVAMYRRARALQGK